MVILYMFLNKNTSSFIYHWYNPQTLSGIVHDLSKSSFYNK